MRLDARTYSYHAGRRYNRLSAMPHAFILGGAGQAGRAIANVLLVSGWSVTLAHRGRHPVPPDLLDRGAEAVRLDRDEPGALNRALADGADALIDVIAYGPEHARQLLQVQNAVGSLIVLSSSSVYRDERGRTLDEAADSGEAGRLLALPDEDLYPPTVGWTPWSVQRPFVLDTAAAASLGYRPAASYPETAAFVCRWLVLATAGRNWRDLFPASRPILATFSTTGSRTSSLRDYSVKASPRLRRKPGRTPWIRLKTLSSAGKRLWALVESQLRQRPNSASDAACRGRGTRSECRRAA